MRSDRRALVARLAPLLLLAALAAAWVAPSVPGLNVARGSADGTAAWETTLDALPTRPIVLIAFDPDLGTYAEVRPTARAALADLLGRDARLVFVSLTPEGRALAIAEIARLERGGANPNRRIDLGYVPGAEAAIVELARTVRVPDGAQGELPRRLRASGPAAFDALLVVGGNELGPRSWVEQFAPRVDPLPILAIAPTVLLPELLPYEDSGQLAALIATPYAGAAYRDGALLGRLERFTDTFPQRSLPILVGLVVAVALLAEPLVRRATPRRAARDGGEAA